MRICVLAGTRRSYLNWLRETGIDPREAQCCLYGEDLVGQEFRRIVTLPAFWDHCPNTREMYEHAITRCRPGTPMDSSWHRAASGRL